MSTTSVRRNRLRSTAAICVLSLVLSACASSTQRPDAAADGDTDIEAVTASPLPSAGGSVPTAKDGTSPLSKEEIVAAVEAGELPKSALDSVNAAPGGTGGKGGSPGTTGGGGNAPATAPKKLAMGHGVTATTIQVGVAWIDLNAYFTAVNAAFGTGAENPSSSATTKEWSEAVIKEQNARGGILGRKIEPIYYEIQTQDLLSPQGRAQSEQQMCDKFTQDNKVFAMIPLQSNEGVLLECAKKTDTPMIGTSNTDVNLDGQRFGDAGAWWFKPNWLSGERRERAMVSRLLAQNWLPKTAKVGIIMEDKPQYRRAVEKGLKPALAAAGIKVVSEVAWPDQVESPWDNYVLKFRSDGVTHVIWSGCGCAATPPGLFMRAAENQEYRPKHALGSEYLMRGIPTIAPHNQLDGMAGIGWGPEFDYGPERAAALKPISAADAQCRKDMAKNNIKIHGGMYCEFVYFLAAALERAPALTRAGFTSGAEALGTGYLSVGTPSTKLGAGRHDGTSAVWDVVFDRACGCIKYKGSPHSIG